MGAIAKAVEESSYHMYDRWSDWAIEEFVAAMDKKGISLTPKKVHWQLDYGRCDVNFEGRINVPVFLKEHEAQLPVAWVMMLVVNDDYADCSICTNSHHSSMYATCELYDTATVRDGFFAGSSVDELVTNGTLSTEDMEEAILTICNNYAYDLGGELNDMYDSEVEFMRQSTIEQQIEENKDMLKIVLKRVHDAKCKLLDNYWRILDGLDTEIDVDDLLELELIENKRIGNLTTAGLNLIQEI